MQYTINTDNTNAIQTLIDNGFTVDGMELTFDNDMRDNGKVIRSIKALSKMTTSPTISIDSESMKMEIVDGRFKSKWNLHTVKEAEKVIMCCDSPFINMDLNYGQIQETYNTDFFTVKASNYIMLQERTYYDDYTPEDSSLMRHETLDSYIQHKYNQGATFQLTKKQFLAGLRYQKNDVTIEVKNGEVSIDGDHGTKGLELDDCTTEGGAATINPKYIKKVLTKIGNKVTVTILEDVNSYTNCLLIESTENKRKALIMGVR